MNRQPPMIDGQRPIAEHVKHLGVHHSRDKIERRIAVGHHRKEREPCAAAN